MRTIVTSSLSYTEKKGKSFLVKLMQNLALALVDTCGSKVLFPDGLGEIFSNPRKDYQIAYKIKIIELRTKNDGTEG